MKAEYVDHMGSDLTVVNAARVSFDKESTEVSYVNEKLINYLASHGHWTPFSHPQITLRYTVPIFVARQEFKHIAGFTRNEVSRRYVDDDAKFFIPEEWRSRPKGSVKQGSGGKHESDEYWHGYYTEYLEKCVTIYKSMLLDDVAPEQARMVLPQSMYTSYYVTGSLAAFARMVKQRSDAHAQVEIQELAKMVDKMIRPLFPVSWKALLN